MLAQSAFSRASSSTFNSRVFVYEVTGLADNAESQSQLYPIRNSSHFYYQVPFGQMNQAMRRFTRLGAKIISIQSLEDFKAQDQQNAAVHSQDDAES